MTPRQRLPNRRCQITQEILWPENGGRIYGVSIGIDQHYRAREIFIHGAKVGSETEAILDDACVMVSRLLQMGDPLEELVRTLGREGVDPSSSSASIIGMSLRKALEMTEMKESKDGW